MTLLVRNEEDIIEKNIRFHAASGVDSFIVMDNLSTDRTAQIIKSLSKEFKIDYIYQPSDTYDQAIWVTKMAIKSAKEHHADWVINSDADEFWVHPKNDLKSMLGEVNKNIGVINVRRYNAIPIGDSTKASRSSPEHTIHFESNSTNCLGQSLPAKVIHRASSQVQVAQGNHSVSGICGEVMTAQKDLTILHFPYRSFHTYCRKIRYGGDAYSRNRNLHESIGGTWREHRKLLENGGLEDFWDRISKTENGISHSVFTGEVLEIKRLRNFFINHKKILKRKAVEGSLFNLQESTNEIVSAYIQRTEQALSNIETDRKHRIPMFYNMSAHLNGARAHLSGIEDLTKQDNANLHLQ